MYIFSKIFSLAGLFTEIVIFVTCLMYMTRSKTTDSRLLFIGALIGLIVRGFYLTLPYMMTSTDSGYRPIEMFYGFASLFSFVSSLIFCIGLVLLIQRVIKTLPANPS
jgi:ABC-type cobalamin transport system permease subunit